MFLFLAFLLSLGHCIQLVNHMPGSTLMGTRAQPVHTTLVLQLQRTALNDNWTPVEQTRFLHEVGTALQQDQCLLSYSGITATQIALKIYCPVTMDNNTETDDAPPLHNTVKYLQGEWHFMVPPAHVNKRIRAPSQWFGGNGNPEQLELVMQRYHERKSHPLNYHSNAVQSPAPWGLDRIDMHFGLLDNEYQYNNGGENVRVYVIDTGVRTTHQEFQGRATFLANTVGDSVNGDCVGHGTHVASVVGGQTYGVAKQARILAVKVLDCTGNGDLFTISAGVMAVIEDVQAHNATTTGFVASMSLGGDYSSSLNQIILTLVTHGITTVVAAGNDQSNACQFSPASLGSTSAVVSVGASNQQDQRPGWSNYGPCVSLSAPGQSILGAFSGSNSETATLSGTSMATPYVSGVAALVLNQNVSLSPLAVKQLLLAWVTPAAITGASSTGGGKNLLYSLIVNGDAPDFSAPTPSNPPPPPPGGSPGHFPDSDSAGTHTSANALLLSLVLLLACTLCFG